MHSGVLVISVSFPGILVFGALFAWLEVELARGARLGKVDFEMPEAN